MKSGMQSLLNRKLAGWLVVLATTAITTSVRGANWAWSTVPNNANFNDNNWTSGTTPGAPSSKPAISGDSIYFGASSQTTLDNDYASLSVNGITFNADANSFTLGGNALTLAGTITGNAVATQTISAAMTILAVRTVTATGGAVTVLSGNISGDGGITLSRLGGAGVHTLTLSGNNSYTNATTLSGGSSVACLNINHNNALGSGALVMQNANTIDNTSGSPVTITNNVNMTATGFTFTGTTNLTINGTAMIANPVVLTVNGSTLTLKAVNADTTARTLTKNGSGTLTITDAAGATFQGGFTLTAGTLILGNRNALGTGLLSTGNPGGALQAATDLSGTNAIGNAVNFANATTLTVSGANNITFTGALSVVNNRTLTSSLAAGRTLMFSGSVTNAGNQASPTFTLAGTGDTTFSGAIADGTASNGMSVTINNTGLTTFSSGANLYRGATTLSGGALDVGSAAGNLPGNSYLKLDGGVLQASGSFTRTNSTTASGANFQWASTNGGGFSARGGKLTVTVGNSAANVQTWGTAAANNGIWGALKFGSASANAEIEFQNAINLLNAAGTTNRMIAVATGAGGDFATLSGIISNSAGTAGLIKTGGGTLKLTAANTYNGVTTVSNGTLLVDNSTGSGTGTNTVTVDAGGYIGGNGTIGASLVMAGGGLAAQAGHTLTVQGNVDLSATNDSLVLVGAAPVGRTVVLAYTGIRTGQFNTVTGVRADYSVDHEVAILPLSPPGTLLQVR